MKLQGIGVKMNKTFGKNLLEQSAILGSPRANFLLYNELNDFYYLH